MRKYSSNLAFVDLLFNLLVGFTSLFIIAFLLINPIAKQGEIEPPVLMMVEIGWDDNSSYDVDLWVKSPDSTVGFTNKESGYVALDRDDLGMNNDWYMVNGEKVFIKRNYEVVNFTALPDGEYIFNIHMFSGTFPAGNEEEVNIRITRLGPFNVVYENKFTLTNPKQERTMVSFTMENGVVVDMNTQLQHVIKSGVQGG